MRIMWGEHSEYVGILRWLRIRVWSKIQMIGLGRSRSFNPFAAVSLTQSWRMQVLLQTLGCCCGYILMMMNLIGNLSYNNAIQPTER